MSSSQYIISLYNSRKTIIQLLGTLNFDTIDYENFSINEVDAMYTNSQLDMLITHTTEPKKVYIKYVNHVRQNNLEVIIEDLFENEEILKKEHDVLILVSDDEPNDCIKAKLEYLYDKEGIFVIIHNIRRLQFNILEHSLVPQVRIINKEETDALFAQYHLSQFPEISRFDPMALAICMKPKQICEIHRKSATALETKYYRVCV
jgi:DNA-directed RNA polymerase subunit H (RpoH/RPB5)